MITIYGASDDLIEVAGCEGADEFNVYGSDAMGPVMWHGDLIAPSGAAMRVHVLYDGCWHVAIGQVDESIPLPDWPTQIRQHTGGMFPGDRPISYSVVLTVEAPEGTRLENIWPADEQDGETDA
ncbi:hypothetical protein [Actinomadura sp. WMMA1423]|uniref:hypothetical protein n=1 Tax=Actinomadura sp. WMMA1423 TaxID=2591108 RepID=UPI00114667C7|nr:hypothetical protein [Actinomadura sp. WMMA1423]